jgi:hypothetical protein
MSKRPNVALWSEADIERLRAFASSGASPLRAAAALKRSMVSVKAKARIMGCRFRTAAEARRLMKATLESGGSASARAPTVRTEDTSSGDRHAD